MTTLDNSNIAREAAREGDGTFGTQNHAEAEGGNTALTEQVPEAPFHPMLAGLSEIERAQLRTVFDQAKAYTDLTANADHAKSTASDTTNLEAKLFSPVGGEFEDHRALLNTYWAVSKSLDESNVRDIAKLADKISPAATHMTMGSNESGSFDAISLLDENGEEVFNIEDVVYTDDEHADAAEELCTLTRDLKDCGRWVDFAERIDRRSNIWSIDLKKAATAGR